MLENKWKFVKFRQKIFDTLVHILYNVINKLQPRHSQQLVNRKEGELTTMKSTGIIRKVDELGRIVLPIELRRTLDIAERDELEIFMENDRIVLQKFEPACIFCGSSRSLVTYRGKNVCQDCISKMSEY